MGKVLIILLCLFSVSCEKQNVNEVKKIERVVLNLSYYSAMGSGEAIEDIVNSFMEKHPGITITTERSNWSGHYEKLRAELAAGEGPDIYLLDGVFVDQYAHNGLIEDLTEFSKEIDEKSYLGIEELRYSDGRLYAIPQGIQVDVLYYNKDMFDEAGLEYPNEDWTLMDLEEASIKLTTDNRYGFSLPPNHIRYSWYPIIRQFGGDILDRDRRNSTIKSDPYVREAMEFIYKMWNENRSVPHFSDINAGFGENSATYFPRGLVAMYYDAYVGTNRIEGRVNYDVVIQPKLRERYNSIIVNSWVINSEIPKRKKSEAWKFIKYYLSEDAQRVHANKSPSLPSMRGLIDEVITESKTLPEGKHAFLQALNYADDLAESAAWSEQNIIFETYLAQYLKDEINIDEFLSLSDEGVQKALDYYYKE